MLNDNFFIVTEFELFKNEFQVWEKFPNTGKRIHCQISTGNRVDIAGKRRRWQAGCAVPGRRVRILKFKRLNG